MDQPATATARPLQAISIRSWIIGGVIAALIAYIWRAPLVWMYERWTQPDSYYSHGFLVPLVALYFVWRDREALLAARAERSMLGLAVFFFGILLLVASGYFVVYFAGAFSLIPAIWGLCGFLFGRRVMRLLLFPAFILLFMVPPPLQTIDNISNNLKLFVADVALVIFNLFGVVSVKEGATIYLGNAVVTVGNACSGLRSLISLLFLGVIFASISPLSPVRRGLLFLASIPIAIISNVVRVLVLCLIAYAWGNEAINAKWGIGPLQTSAHDASGYLIFVVAFALLYGVLKILTPRGASAEQTESAPPADEPPPPRPARNSLPVRLAAVFALLAATATVSATVLYQRGMESAELRTPGIPLNGTEWSGAEVPIDADVTAILETNDVIQRNYRGMLHGNKPVQLAVVYSPANRRVAHPPEVCYTNVGWEVSGKEIRQYKGIPDMVRIVMNHSRRRDIVIYCFLAGDEYTANYYRQQYNIARNTVMGRPTSSALIRISTRVAETESEQEAEDRLIEFARWVMPEISSRLK